MSAIARTACPAAKAALRQATSLRPQRLKASDGLLPSLAHQKMDKKAGIKSDHDTGLAVDVTHDPKNGINCRDAYNQLKTDPRVKYLIFHGRIWTPERGDHPYVGPNPHNHHLHISIKPNMANNTSPWFPWLGKPAILNKVKAALKPLPKKKS